MAKQTNATAPIITTINLAASGMYHDRMFFCWNILSLFRSMCFMNNSVASSLLCPTNIYLSIYLTSVLGILLFSCPYLYVYVCVF